jgi:hypothetical protein
MGFLTGALVVGWRAARGRERRYRGAYSKSQSELAALCCCDCCEWCGQCGVEDFCVDCFYDDVYSG